MAEEKIEEIDVQKLVTGLLKNHRVEELAQLTDRNPASIFRWQSGQNAPTDKDILRKLLALAAKDEKN